MVLRGTYVHLPGPEADLLLNKEHVRLVKHTQRLKHHIIKASDIAANAEKTHTINLSFLNPVPEILVVIRAGTDLTSYPRSYFSYLGKPKLAGQGLGGSGSDQANPETEQAADTGVEFLSWQLVFNGQNYMPNDISRQYTMKRILPLTHSEGYKDAPLNEVYVDAQGFFLAVFVKLHLVRHFVCAPRAVHFFNEFLGV